MAVCGINGRQTAVRRKRCIDLPTIEQRFWSKVNVTQHDSQCWEWEAYYGSDGYGRFHLDGKKEKASRVAYMLEREEPGDNCVLHKCHNPKCVNPYHLYLGDRSDNAEDAKEAGQLNPAKGEEHHKAKLTEDKVRKIRAKQGSVPREQLATVFGVSRHAINDVIARRTWKDVEVETEEV